MARPKKDKALRHTHPVMLRLTDTEYELVSAHAKAAHLPLAEYSRRLVTGKQVKIKYELVADLPELKKLTAQLGKIGKKNKKVLAFLGDIVYNSFCRVNRAIAKR